MKHDEREQEERAAKKLKRGRTAEEKVANELDRSQEHCPSGDVDAWDTPYSYDLELKPLDRSFLCTVLTKARLVQDEKNRGEEARKVRILDVGCGDHAQSARHFAVTGAKVTAVDVAEEACRKAAERVQGLPVCVLQGDMRGLDAVLSQGMLFHGVCAFYSLHHLDPTKVRSVLASLSAWLLPGGTLALAALMDRVPSLEGPTDPCAAPSTAPCTGSKLSTLLRSMHRYFAEPQDLIDMLSALGFVDIECSHRTTVYPNEFPCCRVYLQGCKA